MDNLEFHMHNVWGELVGTMLLVILGGGVVANVILNKTKGQNSGWIVITFGWAMAVFVGINASVQLGSSGHLNPAVTIALALFGDFAKIYVLPYIIAQVVGAIIGAMIVWVAYKQHFDETTDRDAQLGVFATGPAIRNPLFNFLTEVIGTFVLVLGALVMSKPSSPMGGLDAFPVALLVLGIGLSLGGPTGYAINPARDFGPRLAFSFLPIRGKRNGDWSYAWIPILGPIVGGIIAAFLFSAMKSLA